MTLLGSLVALHNTLMAMLLLGPPPHTPGTKAPGARTGVVVNEFVIPTPNSTPGGITTGPDGNIWFTEYDGNKIGRLTLAGVFTEFAVPFAKAPAITAGPDGNLWFTESYRGQVGRITPQGALQHFNSDFRRRSSAGSSRSPVALQTRSGAAYLAMRGCDSYMV